MGVGAALLATTLASAASSAYQAKKNKVPEVKTPAQQLERKQEVGADDVQLGSSDESTAAKGKRSLVRPVATSLGGL